MIAEKIMALPTNQDLDSHYYVRRIMPGVTMIEDSTPTKSCIYLVEGSESAVVIDTGSPCGGDLWALIHKLTDLPCKLIVTHGHPDHASFLDCVDEFYMHAADIPLLTNMLPESAAAMGKCVSISENTIFDLGGAKIYVIDVPGHTPGSVLFADTKHQFVFSGDAFGSGEGVWMQIPGSLTMSGYKHGIEHALKGLKALFGENEPVFLSGHMYQSQLGVPGHPINPVSYRLIEDMYLLCEDAIDHKAEMLPLHADDRAFTEEPILRIIHGLAGCVCVESGFK